MIETTPIYEVYILDAEGELETWKDFRSEEEAHDWAEDNTSVFGDAEIRHYAIGTCECGETVELMEFTNECPNCGALYNPFGQEVRY